MRELSEYRHRLSDASEQSKIFILTERQASNDVQPFSREQEADLRDYWFTIVKHFRLIAALFVGVVLHHCACRIFDSS